MNTDNIPDQLGQFVDAINTDPRGPESPAAQRILRAAEGNPELQQLLRAANGLRAKLDERQLGQ